jgi:hypothetical protein
VKRFPLLSALASIALAFGLSACGEKPIAHYRISKEAAASPQPTAAAAMTGPGAPSVAATPAGPGDLGWTAPAHWDSRPASGPRRATYLFSNDGGATAELAVTVFPGDVGGELANVNRWRGQVQLAPVDDAEHAATAARSRIGELEVVVVDFVGGSQAAPVRLLGAIVPHGESTWFFKFTGAPDVIEGEKAAFLALLNTLHSAPNDHACCSS